MTRKDYDTIAACIGAAHKANNHDESVIKGIRDLQHRLELEFSLDNPKFSLDKFRLRVQYWYKIHVGY